MRLLRWLIPAVLLLCVRVSATPSSSTPAPINRQALLTTALNPKNGLSPDWSFVRLEVGPTSVHATFQERKKGGSIDLEIVPPQVAPDGTLRSTRFAVILPPDPPDDVSLLGRIVVKRLASCDAQWTWPDAALQQPRLQGHRPPPPPPPPNERVIPAGREKEVQEFLLPLAMGKTQVDGYTLDSILIRGSRVELQFVHPGAPNPASILILPPEASAGVVAGPIRLLKSPQTPAALFDAVNQSFLTVPRKVFPWVAPDSSAGPGRWGYLIGHRNRFVQLCLVMVLLLVISTGFLVRRLWRTARPPTEALWALAGLTLLGFVLRWWLSPWTFVHEFYHVDDQVQIDLFNGSGIRFYGAAGPALYRVVNALFGGDEKAIFAVNSLLAALTVPAIALLDLSVFRRWSRALIAAFIFCLLPLHLRFAASEETAIVELFFAVWGLAAFAVYCESRDGWALLAAVFGLALAGNARPEGLLLPVIAFAYVLLARPVREWKLLVSPKTLAAGALLGGILFARFRDMPHGSASAPSLMAIARSFHMTTYWHLVAFLDPSVTPRGLLLLAVMGIVWAALRRRMRLTLWLLGSAVVYLAILLSVFQNPPPSNLRTQLITMPFLVLICAGAWPLAVEELKGTTAAKWAATAGLAALVLFGLYTRVPMLRATADSQQEWAFLRDAVAKLPKGPGKLLTLAEGPMESARLAGHGKIDVFPRFLLKRAQSQLQVEDIETLAATGRWPDPQPGLIFYQGMYCYFYFLDFEPVPDGMNQRCLAVRDRYVLKPLVTRRIPGPGYSPMGYTKPPFEIGFYQVVGRKEPGKAPVAKTGP